MSTRARSTTGCAPSRATGSSKTSAPNTEGGRPARTTYRLTGDGESEFTLLVRNLLWTVSIHDPADLMAAWSFAWALTREEVIAAELRATSIPWRIHDLTGDFELEDVWALPTPGGPDVAKPRSPRCTYSRTSGQRRSPTRRCTASSHLGWVKDGGGGYRGQMAVYAKPNGLLGTAYIAAIRPFRHRIVYPQMLRGLERRWDHARSDQLSAG